MSSVSCCMTSNILLMCKSGDTNHPSTKSILSYSSANMENVWKKSDPKIPLSNCCGIICMFCPLDGPQFNHVTVSICALNLIWTSSPRKWHARIKTILKTCNLGWNTYGVAIHNSFDVQAYIHIILTKVASFSKIWYHT